MAKEFDLRQVDDYIEKGLLGNTSVKESWKNIRNELYRLQAEARKMQSDEFKELMHLYTKYVKLSSDIGLVEMPTWLHNRLLSFAMSILSGKSKYVSVAVKLLKEYCERESAARVNYRKKISDQKVDDVNDNWMSDWERRAVQLVEESTSK